MSDINVTFSSGKFGNSGLQVCIALVLCETSFCGVWSHSMKAAEQKEAGVFIWTPTVAKNIPFISLLIWWSPPSVQR